MNIIYKKPFNKVNYYISQLNNPIYYNLNDVKLNSLIKLSNNSKNDGYYLNVYLDKYDIEFFKEQDTEALFNLILNNNSWFDNKLSEEDIKLLYRQSYCSQSNTLKAILSYKVLPMITINDKIHHDTDELIRILSNPVNYKKYYMSFKIQNVGIYIYNSVCNIKWLIKSITINEINNDICNELSKEEIEIEWKQMIDEAFANIDNKILEYQNIKEKISAAYNNLIDIEDADKMWENKISEIKKYINNIIY